MAVPRNHVKNPCGLSWTAVSFTSPPLPWLASLDGPAFKRLFRGSPLERTGRKRLRRNVAVAMGNSGEAAHLETLQKWTTDEDATLAEAANWALDRLRGTAPPAALHDTDAP